MLIIWRHIDNVPLFRYKIMAIRLNVNRTFHHQVNVVSCIRIIPLNLDSLFRKNLPDFLHSFCLPASNLQIQLHTAHLKTCNGPALRTYGRYIVFARLLRNRIVTVQGTQKAVPSVHKFLLAPVFRTVSADHVLILHTVVHVHILKHFAPDSIFLKIVITVIDIRPDMYNISPLDNTLLFVDTDLGRASVDQKSLISFCVIMIGNKSIFYINSVPQFIDHAASLGTYQKVSVVVAVRNRIQYILLRINVHYAAQILNTHMLSSFLVFFQHFTVLNSADYKKGKMIHVLVSLPELQRLKYSELLLQIRFSIYVE